MARICDVCGESAHATVERIVVESYRIDRGMLFESDMGLDLCNDCIVRLREVVGSFCYGGLDRVRKMVATFRNDSPPLSKEAIAADRARSTREVGGN